MRARHARPIEKSLGLHRARGHWNLDITIKIRIEVNWRPAETF